MKNTTLFVLLLAIALSSCQKDSSDSQRNLLTSISCWHLQKIEFFDSTTNVWVDFFLDDCLLDDCETYHPDGKFTWSNGGNSCAPSDPQSVEAEWSLSNGKINYSALGQDDYVVTIVKLTKSELVHEAPVTDFGDFNLARETFTSD